eukprot:scaffold473_cov132-Cylindrotheca_fusiformis.AAC.11
MGTANTKPSSSSSNRTNMNAAGYIRRAHHAGSWYSADKATLDETLTAFLQDASTTTAPAPTSSLKAVICPHAGYSYSGPTAAYSYLPLQQELERNGRITTILVLHPSHHVYLEGCAISGATILETPLGNLQVDDELRNELLERGNKLFSVMNQKVDEHEHSGEMQYPYIAKACAGRRQYIRVLPIMVGNTNTRQEERYGTILAPIIARLNVVCVISSDFMHWGSRFQYQPTPSSKSMQIYQYIQQLDQQGMDLITLQEPGAFAKYLKETKNTICGRHPIGVWLQAVHVNSMAKVENLQISFVQYNQSSQVQSMRDSSVSYASAIATRTSES